ncbi:DMT family transporter [Sporolituus thermophilus]|uniref:EamA-like transporter family protein n=1 Tax=Sporolituus thermophilus DSM 23256 TaxID=1123285 RepID=A0A1G7P850_9FIRM|nr:DMT family transporter [Sporolituus thermophilus]SDF81779.1 EamA-like transporter family protein [Sporolituus thermophilus DSM 23256]
MQSWLGYFLVLLSAVAFGASSVIIKFTYSTGLEPLPVLVIQNIVATTLAWLWVLITRKKAAIPHALWLPMAAQGAVGGFLTSILFYTALDILGAALATLLIFTYPAFVALYNKLFRQVALATEQVAALVMALIGLIFSVDLFHAQWTVTDRWALLLGLGSAVTNAFLTLNGERLLAVVDTFVVTAWSFTFCTLMLLIVYRPVWLMAIDLSGLQFVLIFTGAVLLLAPVVIYLAGLRRIGAGIASIVSTAEIPITLALAWLFLHETMNEWQIFGGILITLSVVLLYYYGDRPNR